MDDALLGLLGGIGEGLKSGYLSYRDALKQKEDQEYKKALAAREERKLKIEEEAALQKAKNIKTPEQEITNEWLKYGNVPTGFINDNGFVRPTGAEQVPGFARPEKPIDELSQTLKGLNIQKAKSDIEKTAFEKTPKGRLEKAGADTKQKIGFVTSGLENLTNYENVFNKGARQGYVTPQTTVLGMPVGKLKSSTPIDEARVNLEEAIGRLASGGAINKDEETRFRQMIPTASDNDVAAKRKLAQLRSEMENKLTGYGFKTNELSEMGFSPTKLGYGNRNQLSAEDQDALNWANSNPSDPRSVEIKKRLGVQ